MLPEICEVGGKTIISAGPECFVPKIPRKSGQYLIVTNFAPSMNIHLLSKQLRTE